MRKLIIILILFAAPAWSADNQAINPSELPASITHAGANTLGALAGRTTVSSKTDISFHEDGTADHIDSVAEDFGSFESGDTVYVSGSTSNDGYYLVATASAASLILEDVCDLADEVAGDTITITEWPTFYLQSVDVDLNATAAANAITRGGYPMYEAGIQTVAETDKDNKEWMTEQTGIIDGGDDRTYASNNSVKGDYVSFHGETAPINGSSVGGLLIKGLTFDTEGTDWIFSHLNVLPGKDMTKAIKSFALYGTRNVCWHCTTGLSDDENATIGSYHTEEGNTAPEGAGIDNAYIYSIFAESYRDDDSLYDWASKGSMGSGQILRALWLYNWSHSNYQRAAPRIQGGLYEDGDESGATAIIVNNLDYNSGGLPAHVDDTRDAIGWYDVDFIGNISEEGPDTSANIDDKFLALGGANSPIHATSDLYMFGNCAIDSDTGWDCQDDIDDWNGFYDGTSQGNINNASGHNWYASGSGTNEWYMKTDNENPNIVCPSDIELANVNIDTGTLGSLSDHQWNCGDNDSLEYNTVYVRDDSGDPDTTEVLIEVIYTAQAIEDALKNTSEVVGIDWTPEAANAALRTKITSYAGAFPAFPHTVLARWRTEVSEGTGDIPLDALAYPTVTTAERNIATGMVADGYVNWPPGGDPWADTDWCSGNTNICTASDGVYNHVEWLYGLDYYATYGEFPTAPGAEEDTASLSGFSGSGASGF
jgi:hypothetical protein